ncbi:hypothetical protein [Paeniglutamicibacter sp.]|uniref:hypothetical protein n=1 Tax=Paeniglutamicibacter sp. TaxID=1934391 RepID=UPI003989BECC
MPPFTLSTSTSISDAEILSPYNSVGWTDYTNSPDLLFQAIKSSSFVVSAWNRVLIKDDETQRRAFYQSLGLTEGSDFSTGTVRVFAEFR